MPEVNGDVLAAEIKKIDPQQPVILLTGFGDLMSGAGEKPEGVDLVVGKPFTLNSLRQAITKALRMRS
jgi:FixJ family two-component response regulator